MHAFFAVLMLSAAAVDSPEVLDERLQLQLVAAAPDVRTPTGIAVDEAGRVLVIESHTHFRPQNYDGPPHDRILLLEDFDPQTGKAGKISTFFEGTTHTMNLAVYHDGSVFVATRSEIFRLYDSDNDGKSDARRPICRLETPGNYPHNGLSGFAFDFAGNVYFGFGENLGAEYKLIGSDEKTLSGGGEGGNIYCCSAEGGNLRRVATGFWNPFHLCFDAFGRLFAVDNDPDSRPPCRLLHIVEGGDYGFRFRHGRKGVHPFTSWNGELPGTLPMVAGTGEAPSGILAYESDNLPADYVGDLLVTSWGDHRIERYKLRPRGASFTSEMQPVVRGGENFRPVGIALAPDGSLYISDWVDKSYNLHGKGRIWRLSSKQPAKPTRPDDPTKAISSPHARLREAASRKLSVDAAEHLTSASNDPRTRSLAARRVIAAKASPLATRGDEWASLLAAHDPTLWSTIKAGIDSEDLTGALQSLENKGLPHEIKAALWRGRLPLPSADDAMQSEDPFLLQAAAELYLFALKQDGEADFVKSIVTEVNGLTAVTPRWEPDFPGGGRGFALVVKQFGSPRFDAVVPEAMLASKDPTTQLFGLQWIAELRDERQRKNVEWVVEHASTRQVFEAALTTLEMLANRPGGAAAEAAGQAYIVNALNDPKSKAAVRRFALRSLDPDHAALTLDLLTRLLAEEDGELRLEALRTLRTRSGREQAALLREIAASGERNTYERCEAILGLLPEDAEDRRLLLDLTESDDAQVSAEALRVLRGVELTADERSRLTELKAKVSAETAALVERLLASPQPPVRSPANLQDWLAGGTRPGNPGIGSRIFFNPRVGSCYKCHQHSGRGSQVGPDLTTIGQSMTAERLLESIVDPSREVAPQFTTWTIRTTDGQVKTGLHVGDEVDGRMRFVDTAGAQFLLHTDEIDERQPSKQSIMPAGAAEQLTPQELRDLLAFLQFKLPESKR